MSVPYERIVSEDFNLGNGSVTVTMPGGGTATGSKVGIHTFLPYTFNVRDFGATGDGTTNDTAAIQAALDAAEAAGGGTVFVPIGTYLVKQLTIASKVRLQGQGWGSVLSRLDGTTNYALKNEDETAGNTDITIEHLAFDGTMGTDPNTGYEKYGLIFGKVTRLTIRNCYVYDWADGGLALRAACVTVTITDNYFKNNSINQADGQTNVAIISATRVLVQGNIIEGPAARPGFDIEPNVAADVCDDIQIIGNLFKSCGMSGFTVTTNAGSIGEITLSGNTFHDCNAAAIAADAAVVFDPGALAIGTPVFVCSGNAIFGSAEHGILINMLSSTSSAEVLAYVEGNIIYNPGTVTNNTYDGIFVGSDRNTILADNVIIAFAANKPRYGINVNAVSTAGTRRMHGNVIVGAQTADVLQPASANDFQAEVIYQRVKFAGPSSSGAVTPILGAAAPALLSTSPYAWVDVQSSDGSICVMPVWKKS